MNTLQTVSILIYSRENSGIIIHIWLLDTLEINILTLYGPNSFFRRFSGHNLR